VRVLLSRKKWYKAKWLLPTLHSLVMASDWVDHKLLERVRGFLVYVARTYGPLTHSLMGLPMSIYGWRSGRDEEGRRLMEAEVNASCDYEDESESEQPPSRRILKPPGGVKAVPGLILDLEVLRMLTVAEDPLNELHLG
jgi:hypothetical protein